MLEDSICHKSYQRASRGALRIYLRLLRPEPVQEAVPETVAVSAGDEEISEMSAADKQKAKNKLRKEKKKAEQAAVASAVAPAAVNGGDTKKSGIEKPKDEDPNGEKLLLLDPLTEAIRWCGAISRAPKSEPETQELVCAIYLKKGKLSLALRALSCGFALDPTNAGLIYMLILFARVMENADGSGLPVINPLVEPVIREEMTRLLGDVSSSVEYVRQNSRSALSNRSLQHVLVFSQLVLLTEGRASAISYLTAKAADGRRFPFLDGRGVTAKSVVPFMKVSDNNYIFNHDLFMIINVF